jgi:hypothetical protein
VIFDRVFTRVPSSNLFLSNITIAASGMGFGLIVENICNFLPIFGIDGKVPAMENSTEFLR